MKLAIDAMGGDNAPVEVIKGAIEALKEIDANIVLFGKEEIIKRELAKYNYDEARVEIIHAPDVVLNEDKPVKAIKRKKESSMVKALLELKAKKVDAVISAGNTGALLVGGLLRVGRIKGIDRPALASVYPTKKGISVLVDAGANADCKPRNLKEFGIMGNIYAESVLDIKNPTVGLVNVGIEKGKGNLLVQESYDLLDNEDLNFVGNVEAREIPNGACDVIVCDGFTGNVILKLSEGVAKSFSGMLKEKIYSSPISKIGGLLLKNKMKEMKKTMDYTEYGGAPLLGVKGLVVKAHGSSNAKAIRNAIKYAEKFAKNKVVEKIVRKIE